jgi:hypothetical protein
MLQVIEKFPERVLYMSNMTKVMLDTGRSLCQIQPGTPSSFNIW